MSKKILLFSVDFSGVTNKLFSEFIPLDVVIEEHRIPKIWRIYFFSIITTFSPNYKKWVVRAERKYNLLQKTPWAFKLKSKWCADILKKKKLKNYTSIIQVSGTFNALAYFKTDVCFYILTDYTMELAARKQRQAICPLIPPSDRLVCDWYELETALYQRAHGIAVPSLYIKESLNQFYGVSKNKLHNIGYGSNLTLNFEAKTKELDLNKTIKVLFVGKQFISKGGNEIVASVKALNNAGIKTKLFIVGPRVNPGVNMPNVTYLGRIYDKEKLIQLYREADFFMIHSSYEAFGLVLLEAMSVGVPCITSNVDGMPDILCQTGAGKVVQLGDPDAIVNTVKEYLQEPQTYTVASKAGINAVANYYNWPAVSQRFYNMVSSQ
ncbi:glycosyltransferase family 4 protein [Vibrio sinaloensis]|uniref:Glycosyl transferase family 1 domain-containing protein n=1 Tax=Photobacterium sp. (strain ATCC 43367) TaxID=379097 RepID=A0A0A5JQ94_PHOS4|nr:glycosyltransferase family 4 protein [Vibrio sinaloensis]KGY10113.1 hypothetical protein NM06_04125 [Vibrio sinaloensis]